MTEYAQARPTLSTSSAEWRCRLGQANGATQRKRKMEAVHVGRRCWGKHNARLQPLHPAIIQSRGARSSLPTCPGCGCVDSEDAARAHEHLQMQLSQDTPVHAAQGNTMWKEGMRRLVCASISLTAWSRSAGRSLRKFEKLSLAPATGKIGSQD